LYPQIDTLTTVPPLRVPSSTDCSAASAHTEAARPSSPHARRTVQSTLGLATGTLVFGVALGGLFALTYTLAQGRLGSLSARGTALTVAGGGFLAVYVLPGLKYPANPPGTSNSDTITDRTQWYS